MARTAPFDVVMGRLGARGLLLVAGVLVLPLVAMGHLGLGLLVPLCGLHRMLPRAATVPVSSLRRTTRRALP